MSESEEKKPYTGFQKKPASELTQSGKEARARRERARIAQEKVPVLEAEIERLKAELEKTQSYQPTQGSNYQMAQGKLLFLVEGTVVLVRNGKQIAESKQTRIVHGNNVPEASQKFTGYFENMSTDVDTYKVTGMAISEAL